MHKLVSPDVNNVAIEDATSLSASKTTSELNNHMDEQEECMENIQLNDQDDEDEEENSSGDEGNDLLYFWIVIEASIWS